MIDLDCFNEKEITCPHCKYKDLNSWELKESGECECGECGKEFYVEIDVDVRYTSSRLDKTKD